MLKTISVGRFKYPTNFAALLRKIGFGGETPVDFDESFYVYDRNSTKDKSPTTNEGIELSYAANIQLPTFKASTNSSHET